MFEDDDGVATDAADLDPGVEDGRQVEPFDTLTAPEAPPRTGARNLNGDSVVGEDTLPFLANFADLDTGSEAKRSDVASRDYHLMEDDYYDYYAEDGDYRLREGKSLRI